MVLYLFHTSYRKLIASSLPPMICIVLGAELIIPASVQCISTPFRPLLTLLIITLDI